MSEQVELTNRGFEIIRFEDIYGKDCSLQQSSLAVYEEPGTGSVWLGVHGNRMHLDEELAHILVHRLTCWLNNGTLQELPVIEEGTQDEQ